MSRLRWCSRSSRTGCRPRLTATGPSATPGAETYTEDPSWCHVDEQCEEAGGIVFERGFNKVGTCQWSERSLPEAQEDELRANCEAASGRLVLDGNYYKCTVPQAGFPFSHR